ncbi:ATP-binding cassette domain-containing protein [Paenibacillus sp. J5C_2022]|uniref:ABC transporter ATP-binding protein n=1 Tax=Paenibacillus sp. J5C2022 TaxID=2977129 RepID=UPI0021CF8E98|nr:ATP-binding cassette domain-containing protein [Paenibacillus sp. J5C2022]MCU6710353.1 ATP-binding cassette domain-containing protein [Paenibacillus sp. J5C2022]
MMRKPIIELQDIGKTFQVAERTAGLAAAVKSLFIRKYRKVEALNDISFSIGEGEIVGYIGPNGAGKSTTIKVMSGILVPDKGSCTVMGFTPWRDRTPYVKHIGVVFGQRSQLWWDVPVIDSFQLLRDIYRIPEPIYRDNLKMLTDMLALDDILGVPVRQLSLGQRMRCEIAASLLHNPKLLFLDEPTIGLDAVSKIAVRKFIKRINRERGVTVILTTHDMSDIEALADRILMIGKGTLLYDGTLPDLKARFGSGRMLTIDYREHAEPIELPGASRLSWTPERAVYAFDAERTKLADLIAPLSQHVELLDIAVDEKGIDEIIVQLYEEHQI